MMIVFLVEFDLVSSLFSLLEYSNFGKVEKQVGVGRALGVRRLVGTKKNNRTLTYQQFCVILAPLILLSSQGQMNRWELYKLCHK